jgi:tRNA splicing endonuclease
MKMNGTKEHSIEWILLGSERPISHLLLYIQCIFNMSHICIKVLSIDWEQEIRREKYLGGGQGPEGERKKDVVEYVKKNKYTLIYV